MVSVCGLEGYYISQQYIKQGLQKLKYKGSYIVYSLGNFCFGGNTNPSDKDTMIYQQTFVFRGKKLLKKKSIAKVIPCSLSSKRCINNYQPKPVSKSNRQRILGRIKQYSQQFGVSFQRKQGKRTNILK